MSKTRGFDENHFYRWPLTSIIKITMILRCIKFHRMLAYMKELSEYFKQPCSFRNRLLFSLSVLTVFQSSSVAVSGLDDNDFNIISNCSTVPPTNCPTATELIAFREQCINGFERDICPDGTTYLCGVVPGYLIETCAVDKECWPGTFFNYIVRNGIATVECIQCPNGTFETEHTRTSHSSQILGCTYRHIPQDDISSNLVVYENGTHASPSIYRCKTEEGFYDEHGNRFCDDIPTHSCKCIFKYCQSGYRLHPLGYCLRCKKALRPEKDWRCEDYISDQTTKSGNNLYVNSTTYLNATAANFGSSGSALKSSSKKNADGKVKYPDATTVIHPPGIVTETAATGVWSSQSRAIKYDVQTSSVRLITVIGVAVGVVAVVSVSLLLINKWRSNSVRHKESSKQIRHCHDNRCNTNINNFINCSNVLAGKGNTMTNMETPLDVYSHFPEENDENGIFQTPPDDFKLDKFESEPFLQDRDQTEKKEVDYSLH